MTEQVDDCTCQGGADQPHGTQLRANDCPIHGDDDDEPEYSLEDNEAAYEIGGKVVEMADRVRVAHRVAPGAEAHWAFEMDDVRYDVRVTVAGRAAGRSDRAEESE